MMTRFSTAVSALTLAAFIISNSRADEFALLQIGSPNPRPRAAKCRRRCKGL